MKEVEFEGINYLIGENAQDNWDFLNDLTSEQIEGMIQNVVKEDLNGQQ